MVVRRVRLGPIPSVGRLLSTKVCVFIPTSCFPIGTTFGGRALFGAVAVMAGAVTLAAAVNTPATTVMAARRARQRRGLRASIIVTLRSFGRSRHLLLKRR